MGGADAAKLLLFTPAAMFFMLHMHRKSMTETLVVMTALPFSLIGSILLLAALG